MTSQEYSQNRRIENEVVFREHNEKLEQFATKVLSPNSAGDLILNFVCECSNEDCRTHIQMPVNQFIRIHADSKQFVVKKGHAHTDIERVVRGTGTYQVVEKHQPPPPSNGKLNKT